MTDINTTIARVLELDEAGTAGPWSRNDATGFIESGETMVCDYVLQDRDATLIAHYRTAAPDLARECERRGELCERVATKRDAYEDEADRLASKLGDALQIITNLEDLHRVRDTRKGEWPDEGERVHSWDGDEWWSWQHGPEAKGFDGELKYHFWLPAPPPPTESD